MGMEDIAKNTVPTDKNISEYFDRLEKHRKEVLHNMSQIAIDVIERAIKHDISKYQDDEKKLFRGTTTSDCTYGSLEYFRKLDKIKEGLKLHYARNDHHPEHFENGIEGMNLINLLEHIVDSFAASRCYADDGDINRSIDINKKRFGYDNQLEKIIRNTVKYLQNKIDEEINNE